MSDRISLRGSSLDIQRAQPVRKRRARITIGSLMIASAVFAGLLALFRLWSVITALLLILCVPVLTGHWLVYRRRRRLAALIFWFMGLSANVLYAVLCFLPHSSVRGLLILIWLILLPTFVSIGPAWAVLASSEYAVPRRSVAAASISVVAIAVLPVLTLVSMWPLRLAFLTARPSLDILADQVSAGQTIGFPRQFGCFVLADSFVDPKSKTVTLLVEPIPNMAGKAGFVRVAPGASPWTTGRFRGADLKIWLGGGWEYRTGD